MDLRSQWLIRFRWAVIAGQLLILVAAWTLKSRAVSAVPIFLILGAEVAINLALARFGGTRIVKTQGFFGLILTTDVLLLTLILIYSGGAMNPYTIFYLVEVAAVAVLLNARWAWLCVLLCVICYGSLFLLPHARSMPGMPGMTDPEFRLHLYGMLTSFIIAAICVAYFITQIQQDRLNIRKQLNASLEKTSNMRRFASLTAVAAGAAHELATPLGTIAIAAGELERQFEGGGMPPEITEDITLIRSQVRRCRDILDQMDPGGPGQHNFHRLTIRRILDQVASRVAPDQASRINVVYPEDSREFLFPESRLLQGLASLVQNAIEASPMKSPIELAGSLSKAYLTFTVRDYGSGLPAEVRDRIGEPFFSTKSGGRGLGVFLVRQMVEEYGGTLRAENNSGGGARFTVEFPLESVV